MVAHKEGFASIAEDMPPWLATAGSGDVLAGIAGGFFASHAALGSRVRRCWLHGAAARHFGPGLIAEDIPEHLPAVLQALFAEGILRADRS